MRFRRLHHLNQYATAQLNNLFEYALLSINLSEPHTPHTQQKRKKNRHTHIYLLTNTTTIMPAKKRSTSTKKKKTSTKKTKDASPSELRALFDLMDTDGSGAID
jgi:hypothetical protein